MSKIERNIVCIDEAKCTGCGLCVPACHEGALQIVDGKARLVKEIYCDGLGDCLGECPEGAITIDERVSEAFDEQAVQEHLKNTKQGKGVEPDNLPCNCPGSLVRQMKDVEETPAADRRTGGLDSPAAAKSCLRHWPVQIHLLPPTGELWANADVLIAADCVAFAMPDFHSRLLDGRAVAVGCPKLDDLSAYIEKLTAIFANNEIRSVTVAHMEVPCCAGIVMATRRALEQAQKTDLPFRDVTVGVQGAIKDE